MIDERTETLRVVRRAATAILGLVVLLLLVTVVGAVLVVRSGAAQQQALERLEPQVREQGQKVQQLSAALLALQQRPVSPATPGAELADLQRQSAAQAEQLKALSAQVQAAALAPKGGGGTNPQLERRLSAAEKLLAEGAAKASPAPGVAPSARLEGRLAALEEQHRGLATMVRALATVRRPN